MIAYGGQHNVPNYLLFYYYRRRIEKGPEKQMTFTANAKRELARFVAKRIKIQCFISFFAYGKQTETQQLFGPAAKNVARPKARVALRATRPSAVVAENGYFGENVAA